MLRQFSASLLITLLGCLTAAQADEPAGYYNSCEGKSGAQLLSTLCNVVGPHTTVSYDGLWDIYPETDSDPQGKLWDMYSTKRWTWGSRPCGNYSSVGDCYNREHSFPKSWFSEASPMKSDAFHVYPTDGKVNGQRSNHPYGECANGTQLASNGNVHPLGKLGSSTFPGYTGTVFEPDDEYKGDFARSYFYMAAAYNDRIASWNSPQLAGNRYPAFSSWSVDMLLKWHRQDPVSAKEIDRNEAVYRYQHNRNPFIDHPEMAEHIWGSKKSQGWSSTVTLEPVLSRPAEGAVIDFGTISAGVTRYYDLYVSGANFTEPLTVTVSGSCFRSGSTSIPAAAVNSGIALHLSALSPSEGTVTGSLTLSSGTFSRTVQLRAVIVNGLPALAAANVTENSFMARWVNIDNDEAVYTLHVKRGADYLPGYPKEVLAEEERYAVTGLEPATTYEYYVTNYDLVSNHVTVTTASPEPMVQLLYDGDLYFTSQPGQPSEARAIDMDIENIPGDISVRVSAPFELSTDKAAWDTDLTLVPGEERFYLRLNGLTAGVYESDIVIVAGDYVNDDFSASGMIGSVAALTETFESGNFKNSYGEGPYEGDETTWYCEDIGVYQSDGNLAYEGRGCARFGKTAASRLEMTDDMTGGIGVVSFVAHPWTNDPEARIAVEASTDGGVTWTIAGSVTLPAGSPYTEYSVAVNCPGHVRMRLRQDEGSRVLVDNISVTGFVSSLATPGADRDMWDAWCRDGELVVETAAPRDVTVYSIDALTLYRGTVVSHMALRLPAGIYLVVSGESSQRVLVK